MALKDAEVARRFATASREAFSELVTQAITRRVAFVLIAGDLYDGDWKDTSVGLFFNREVARLARADIPVFIIRGNHDAESEVSRAVPLPASVIELSSRKAETRRIDELKVAIHGRSFADRAATENFALAYPAPLPGWFNIGMLHTSCEGNTAHAVYAPCTVADLVGRGYDYWALGHVHEHAVLHRDPWIVYPGNLQGRNVRECGAKGAVLVDVADGRVAGVQRIEIDQARWHHVPVDVTGIGDEHAIIATVRAALQDALAGSGLPTALRVTLTGRTTAHRQLKQRSRDLGEEIQALIDHVHEDAWLESVKIATTELALARPERPRGGLDPEKLLEGFEQDTEIRSEAAALLALVKAKIPGGVDADALDDLDAILSDARTIALARSLGSQEAE